MTHLSKIIRTKAYNINDKRFFFFATEKCKRDKLSYFCNKLDLKGKWCVCDRGA